MKTTINMSFTGKLGAGLLLLMMAIITITSCKKDYYKDTGLAKATFDGTILQYLESKPLHFDTLAKIIKLAGMENTFNNEEITFFAPPDPTIQVSIRELNQRLLSIGRDTVSKLEDIKPQAWKILLSSYIFKGTNRLKDYKQVDTLALDTYAGQGYLAYSNVPYNIGVVYNDAKNDNIVIKYAGYRQLMISYIPDWTNPKKYWINALVSSSDINPKNGIVHALKIERHAFGFNTGIFSEIALQFGIGN
ncbi:fasciclin domain-containing protein [Pedobacter chitinilyticus]|uniref:Uncharacterized protein n=1 Tax=Pedobacter chitinilyticus TaxID=2233776 RepID=A0A443YMU5_9SPHI|nr:fasciclin domain-containing protein [Pedobacter chitinilyticus]RWU05071.1 hypothetical protein DPV69_18080 [Pedobacter chitinilyticus]